MSAIENVLVIPATCYTNSPDLTLAELKDVIAANGKFLERSKAEADPNYLQIIPYILLYNGTQLFLYQRTKKGSENRLHDKYSIGVGGHVNDEDWDPDYGSTWIAVESCAYRELTEEFNITERKDGVIEELIVDFKDCIIFDPSNEVGRVHLGILCVCDLSHRTTTVAEAHKMSGSFVPFEKVKSKYQNLETWSQIVVDYLDQ